MANKFIDLNKILNEDEIAMVRTYGIYGRLPYDTIVNRVLVDGIAHKLAMAKRYRGPRRSRRECYYNECIKADAVAVKLYRYPNWKRWGRDPFTGERRYTVALDLKVDGLTMETAHYYEREILHKFGPR